MFFQEYCLLESLLERVCDFYSRIQITYNAYDRNCDSENKKRQNSCDEDTINQAQDQNQSDEKDGEKKKVGNASKVMSKMVISKNIKCCREKQQYQEQHATQYQ